MKEIIKILLADDQSLFRDALGTLFSSEDGFDVVGNASNGEEALKFALKFQPDVVLMDLRMPVMDGVVATQRLHEQLPKIKVIVLTTLLAVPLIILSPLYPQTRYQYDVF